MNTDTPETDGIVEQCYRQINVPTNPIPADFARKLERERDELLAGMQIIARKGGGIGRTIARQFLQEG